MPLLARHTSGDWFVILRCTDAGVLTCAGDQTRLKLVTWEALADQWTGIVVVVGAGRKDNGPSIGTGLSWLLPTLARYRGLFAQVLVASVLIQLAAVVTPLMNQVVIDRVFSQGVRSTLEVMAIGLVLAAIFEAVLAASRTYLFSHTAARIDVELGARLFDHLLKLPTDYFETRRAGHTVARLAELNRVREFVTSSSLMIVVDLAFSLIFFAIMTLYSVALTAIVAGSVVLYIVLFSSVTALLRPKLDEQFRRSAESQAFLTETVSNAATVKALALEAQMQRGWEDRLAAQARAGFESKGASQWGPTGADLIMRLTQAAVLFVGAGEVIAGQLTVGEYIAFSMFSIRATQPVVRLAQVWSDFQQFRVSLKRLGELALAPVEPGTEDSRSTLPKLRGRIVFDRVSFRYAGTSADVLTNLSFEIGEGELVALQGPSGSGKTTVLKLLLRQLTPTSGRILIDGVDIGQTDPVWLRRQIGWVAQDPVLFSRSVRENIAISRPEAEIERVIEAARLADAHDFVIRLPKGYDTPLEERGANLSGGQRQRLTIARALLGRPALLLMDEPTSALDGIARNRFIARLPMMTRNLAGVIVSHDQKVVAACHRIIELRS